jgi:hypothetical protein
MVLIDTFVSAGATGAPYTCVSELRRIDALSELFCKLSDYKFADLRAITAVALTVAGDAQYDRL